jgi:hypothetical protein
MAPGNYKLIYHFAHTLISPRPNRPHTAISMRFFFLDFFTAAHKVAVDGFRDCLSPSKFYLKTFIFLSFSPGKNSSLATALRRHH